MSDADSEDSDEAPTYTYECHRCGQLVPWVGDHDCPEPAAGQLENGRCPMCDQPVDEYLTHLRKDCGARE